MSDILKEAFVKWSAWKRSPSKGVIAASEEFEQIMAEHDREIAERAWDEAASIDAGCHDCIALGGYVNPYRSSD